MALFGKNKCRKSSGIVWRNSNGDIACSGDDCQIKKCDESCPIYLNTLALNMSSLGQDNKALEIYEKALVIAPDFYDAWNNMAAIYGAQGNYAKAYECYLKAHELKPNKPNPLYGLVLACRDLQKYEECIKWCNEYDKFNKNGKIDEVRKLSESRLAKKEVTGALDKIKSSFYDIANQIINNSDMDAPNINEFINIDKFSSDIFNFCNECYAESSKLIEEYFISAYYAAICVTILHIIDENSFNANNAFQFLQSKCDTEFCDVYSDKLFGYRKESVESDTVWNFFLPYLNVALQTTKQPDEVPVQLIKAIMEPALALGIAAANYYYEPNEEKTSDYIGIEVTPDLLAGRNYYHFSNRSIDLLQPVSINTDDINIDENYFGEDDEANETDHYHTSLKAYISKDCWIKRINACEDGCEAYYIVSIETESSRISNISVIYEEVSCAGNDIFMIPGIETPSTYSYDELDYYPNEVEFELELLSKGRALTDGFSFIGKMYPSKLIEEEGDTFAIQSAFRKAYIDVSPILGGKGLIEDFEYTTYQSTGSGYWDMFSRPQLIDDKKEEMLDAMLHILDSYSDEEYADYLTKSNEQQTN